MKDFKRGIVIGLGIITILIPTIIGINIVYAINDNEHIGMKTSYAPTNYLYYTFEDKDVNASIINDTLGKANISIKQVIKNYRTKEGKLVDIMILDTNGLTLSQQALLQSLYQNKIITGLQQMPEAIKTGR